MPNNSQRSLDHDVFEPRTEPARSIYRAFQEEAAKRRGRAVEDWTAAELRVVHEEAERQAKACGLRPPSLEEVASAERYARGSVDYGANWAYQVVNAMHRPAPPRSAAGNLSEYDKKILAALDTVGGFVTRDVAAKVQPMFGHSKRTHSGAIRSWLTELERKGLVGRLDDQKPVCWIKTAAGAAIA